MPAAVQSLYRLPLSLREDLEQLRQMTERFKAGAIPAARYQAFRVPQGIYEQRESGTYMLRVRLPAGMLLPQQMRLIADVSRKHGNSTLHLTSRQDIQVHRVPLEGIHPALVELAEAGLSTKGGGGNTVRNIAACHLAGVCPREMFDVTPHVVALTEFMLPDTLSYQLPRKYKIAFSGCGEDDCAGATVNDLGFVARQRDGVDGFAVYVGGGMGAHSQVGMLLEEFVAAGRICHVAEAVKRVFDKHGNRKNRHRARIRFLIEEIGLPRFTELYRQELAQLHALPATTAAGAAQPAIVPATTGEQGATAPRPGFEAWRKSNVLPQKQSGFFVVEIAPPMGVIGAEALRRLADVVERYGERMVRTTNWQNVVLRWVPEADLPKLHADLSALGLGEAQPALLRHLVACAGAATCRLGICLARGLAGGIATALRKSGLALQNGTGNLSLHISGCPNSCGRHPIAQIGFFGAARRVNGRLVPHYVLQLGGRVGEGKTTLATGNLAIPARNVPAFLVDFLRAFEQSSQHPDFAAFLEAGGRAIAEQLVQQRHAAVPDFEQDKNAYFDWGADRLFSLAGRGPGECGAGVFDLIEVDLASAAQALEAGRLFSATALSARALLVTRGEQADNDRESLSLFRKHFVEQKLIAAELHALIDQALAVAGEADPEVAVKARRDDVSALLAAVRKIYEAMGPSLRAAAPAATACGVTPVPTCAPAPVVADLKQDFRGVSCPLNYVKTKMALGRLKPGQTLAVLLDEQGAKNVPASAASDGHEVVAVMQQLEGHWQVVLRKKG